MDLKYRENLNQKFKLYRASNRIYEGYEINKNEVTIDFQEIKIRITYFNDEIVKVFFFEDGDVESITNAVILKAFSKQLKIE